VCTFEPGNFTGWGGYISTMFKRAQVIVQELCESRGGRPGLSVLTNLLVSVEPCYIEPWFGIGHNLSLICQLTSEDIKHHFTIIIRAQERSRAGRWSWALVVGRFVSLQTCSSSNCCSTDTVFVTLLRTAVETAISEVHKLLRTGGVPTSSKVLFWRWLTVYSVFTGRSSGTKYS